MEINNTAEQDANNSKGMARLSSDSTEGEQIQLQQQQQIVPIVEENYSISKRTTTKEAKIEKRAVTKTKSVKVPIAYEELSINGRKLKSAEKSQILSALKDKITSLSGSGDTDTSVEQSIKEK